MQRARLKAILQRNTFLVHVFSTFLAHYSVQKTGTLN